MLKQVLYALKTVPILHIEDGSLGLKDCSLLVEDGSLRVEDGSLRVEDGSLHVEDSSLRDGPFIPYILEMFPSRRAHKLIGPDNCSSFFRKRPTCSEYRTSQKTQISMRSL